MAGDLAAGQRVADIGRGDGFPEGGTTRAPCFRQRAASGISAVTHTSRRVMRSAIQSSAASAAPPTRIIWTFGSPGGRNGRDPFETTKTGRRSRVATRYTSPRTGQASPST
jgi:hypothetical protein